MRDYEIETYKAREKAHKEEMQIKRAKALKGKRFAEEQKHIPRTIPQKRFA